MDWAGEWCWLDRYELEDLANEVLSSTNRGPTMLNSSTAHRIKLGRAFGKAGCGAHSGSVPRIF
jgi:hypothetical protein